VSIEGLRDGAATCVFTAANIVIAHHK